MERKRATEPLFRRAPTFPLLVTEMSIKSAPSAEVERIELRLTARIARLRFTALIVKRHFQLGVGESAFAVYRFYTDVFQIASG